jgi:acyl-CoA carboxylase subunit alpha
MEAILTSGELLRRISLRRDGESVTALVEDAGEMSFRVLERGEHRLLLEVDGRRLTLHYAIHKNRLYLQGLGWWKSFELLEDEDSDDLAHADQAPVVKAPMPGKVLEILAAVGDEVRAGQAVLRVEAMKMEVDLNAPFDGVVVEVAAELGRIVDPEEALMRFEAVAPR